MTPTLKLICEEKGLDFNLVVNGARKDQVTLFRADKRGTSILNKMAQKKMFC